MIHKKTVYTFISFILIYIIMHSVNMVSSGSTIIYVDINGGKDYTSIKSAISNASAGSIIYVYSGVYNENLIIDKQLTLVAVQGEVVVINASSSTHVIKITADYVNISGLIIQNAKGTGMKCIYIDNANYCTVYSCTIQNSKYSDGVQLFYSNYNTIQGNTIRNNNQYGLNLYHSNYNTIKGNNIRDNQLGIELYSSTGNTISDGNVITRNNLRGIRLRMGSNNNIIVDNTINTNSVGVECSSNSNDNIFYHNRFDNSGNNANDSCSNTWDNGYPSGGNYWSDYTGIDSNNDGIGDTPYSIPGGSNIDRYPLYSGNKKPVVTTATATPTETSYGDTVRFTGEGFDPDGYITRYRWASSINGVIYNGSSSSFSTSTLSPGIHNIEFTVRDDKGAWSDYYMITVTINPPVNQKPVAHIVSINPSYAYYGSPVYMNGYGTDDGSITGYRWVSDIDGILSTSQYFSISNLSVGKHNISFYVKDDKGVWSEPDKRTVIIEYSSSSYNKPPVPVITSPDSGRVNTSIVFDASGSSDPDGFIVDYTWNISGAALNGVRVEYMFQSVGVYTVYLRVTDNNGSRNTTSKTISIMLTGGSGNGSTSEKSSDDILRFIPDKVLLTIAAPLVVVCIFIIVLIMFIRWFKKS